MFNERLKMLRKEMNVTQQEIADKLNVSRQSYVNWETGRREPGIKILIDIANLFEVSIDYLCGDTNIKTRYIKDNDLCEYVNESINALNKFEDRKHKINYK
ncbi:MAG: helix-turn-helix transcriptional regulator [Clostridium butyricum]|nr:helix-turn-helix transcriptional regulator [Clostridium butyricum]